MRSIFIIYSRPISRILYLHYKVISLHTGENTGGSPTLVEEISLWRLAIKPQPSAPVTEFKTHGNQSNHSHEEPYPENNHEGNGGRHYHQSARRGMV